MKNKTIYELTPAQDVPYLQCKYTLFKRVINILSSITLDEDIDFDIMKDAFNKVLERNDCLRIKFFKKKGQLLQYFDEPKVVENIPILDFKTKEEQDSFIAKIRKSGIKFLKGKVIEPYFIKTYDNKNMIFLKVCHLVLDIYGLNVIYKDLLQVYYALKNNKALPEAPNSYEEVIKKDLEKKHNKEAFETLMRINCNHAEFVIFTSTMYYLIIQNYPNSFKSPKYFCNVIFCGMFAQCETLKSIKIHDSVTQIDEFAFAGCENLKEVVFGENVETISKQAFTQCTSLDSIHIPSNIKVIGEAAFERCSKLSNLHICDGV